MKKIWITGIIPVALVAVIALSGCGNTTTTLPGSTSTVTTTIITADNNQNPSSKDIVASTLADGSTIIATSQQAGIYVNGSGVISVTPDIANLSLGIRAQEPTVAAAQAKAIAAMAQVMTVLKANNIADKDIMTQQYSISQVYKYDNLTGQSTVTGYSVTNVVTVKIRNVDNTGKVIDAVAAAGGDLTVINSISFSVDNPSQYYPQARELAMADAKAKATQLANLGGVTLGGPLYITENTYTQSYPIYVSKEAGLDSSSTSISAGETDITISVQVTYSIQ